MYLTHGLAETANVVDQLRGTLAAPLTKKLYNQLKRAHDAGYPTILVLDQQGGPPRFGGNWLASDSAIAQVVTETIATEGHRSASHSVDLVLIVDGDTTGLIFGAWPTSPNP